MTHPSEVIGTFSKVCFQRAVVFLVITMFCSLVKSADTAQAGQIFDVSKFGAKGDGAVLDTAAIQSAIDAANKAGGGMVLLPAGRYLSGSLVLKSHVELHLAKGATLLGSTSRADYQRVRWYALLLAKGQEDIKLSGEGTIDGQGRLLVQDINRRMAAGEYPPQERTDRPDEDKRPLVIEFSECRGVKVSGVTLRNSSGWLENYIRCENLVIEGIKVDDTCYWNNDGMDITDCRNVQISKCDINSADDGICLKSGTGGKGCAEVEIADCRIRSSASALKFGTASRSGFRNIHATNLTIYDTFRSAVALEAVDGGTIDHVLIENIRATNTGNAIFLRLGQRDIKSPPGILHDVVIRNLYVEVPAGKPDARYEIAGPPLKYPHNLMPSSITGLPGHPVQGVTLENIEIVFAGGGMPERARVALDALGKIPEQAHNYPEFSMFGELPAWGFYLRHVDGVEFKNVRLTLKDRDFRPALVCDDVESLRLNDINIGPFCGEPVIVLSNTRGAHFQNIHYPDGSREKIRPLNGSSVPEEVAR